MGRHRGTWRNKKINMISREGEVESTSRRQLIQFDKDLRREIPGERGKNTTICLFLNGVQTSLETVSLSIFYKTEPQLLLGKA